MDKVALANLEDLLHRASAVEPMEFHWRHGSHHKTVIGMRHDVDDRGWDSVLDMARWEHARGYRSTYYFLHTAPYWGCDTMQYTLRQIVDLGHEIGLHNNALVEGICTKQDPWEVFDRALFQLRAWSGYNVTSTAAHGDARCYDLGVVNYAMFADAPIKPPWKTAYELGIEARELPYGGIDFCGDWLPRANYISDSGDEWTPCPPQQVAFPSDRGPLFILQHPDWWRKELFR